jgi:hypothetical protein
MVDRTHTDNRVSAPESKFYLPAWGIPSSAAGRLKRLWATLFNHGVDAST